MIREPAVRSPRESRSGSADDASEPEVGDRRRLAVTEARYRDLFERMSDGAYITEGTRFIDVNSAFSTMFGYSREEILAMPTPEIYERPEDREPFLASIDRDGAVSDYRLRLKRKDGMVLDCLVTAWAHFDENGRCAGFQGVVRDVTEKQKLEEALRRSEADYRGLFEHAHDAILILDPATEIVLDANPRAASLYGLPSHELIGRSMLEFSVDVSHGRECVEQTLHENGAYVPLESKQYRCDGSVMEVEIHAAGITYGGRPAILSINRDVTERRQEERRVRESEEKFRLLLESVVDYAIYMIDPEGRVVSWNEGAERMFGFEAKDVTERSFSIFYTPEQQAAGAPARDLQEASGSGRAEREEPRVRKNGTSFDASVVLTRILDEKSSLRGFAQVTRDVTERTKLEAAQREMLEVIQNVATEWTRTFDAVGMPILLLDDEGRIRRLNQAAATLAARGVRDLIDRCVEEIAGEPWQTISALSRFFVHHGVPTEAQAEDRKSGRVWQIAATAAELSGQRRLIVVAQDLTTVTRLEESLRQTELTAALGALVAGVAHEVRNPLFTISATLDTCEARLAASLPELQRYTTPLREEITRLNQLMQELLDYGKPRPLEHADLDLADVVRAAIAHSRGAAPRGVEIALELECGPVPITGDSGRLQQVLRNVIDNAMQHSPDGEQVIVRVRDDVTADSKELVVEILDRGRGFSDADLRSAFVPFYTRRRGGTGLGLAIAQKFIRAHGGDITLHNRPDRGAMVRIVLPQAVSKRESAALTA